VGEPLGIHSLADSRLAQRLDRAVLEDARAHPSFYEASIARLEDDRLNALQVQQVGNQQTGGSGADDADLGAHSRIVPNSCLAAGLDFRRTEGGFGMAVAARTVTQRVLAVLDAFGPHRPALTLSEISRLAELRLTTAHRQVAELTRWGALERGEDGRYRIGLKLWELGALAPRSVDLREAALPVLEDLYEATHQNVQLAVLDGHEVVYVERITGRSAVSVVTRPGTRLPLHATAVGLVLLAHATAADIDAVLAAPLKRYTAHTVTDPGRLRRILADTRRQGYAISDRQIEEVSASIAAPVRDRTGAIAAALSVVVPTGRLRHYVPAVLTAARGVSRRLSAAG
jgi:DNA-binding IclR family transcriptional regulator